MIIPNDTGAANPMNPAPGTSPATPSAGPPFLTRRRWIVFPITLACFGVFALLSIDSHHDGLMLKAAADAASGLIVYRDSFNQYGFLTSYLQAIPVRLFGCELLGLKLLTVLFYALIAWELDRLWERFLSPAFRWLTLILFWTLAPFFLHIMHVWSSVYALYFMLLSGVLLIRHLDGGRLNHLFFCGLAAGTAFGFRQPCGLVMGLAALAALGLAAWGRRVSGREAARQFGMLALGGAIVPLLLALYLTVYRAWPDYLIQMNYVARFGWERGGAGKITDVLSAFFPKSGFVVFPLATLGLFGWSVQNIFRRRNLAFQLPLAAALLTGLASWHQFYPVPCVRHLYWSSVPMFGAFAFLLQLGCRKIPKKRLLIPAFLLAAAWPAYEITVRLHHGGKRLYHLRTDRTMSRLPGSRGLLLFHSELNYYRRIAEAFERIPPEFREREYLNLTPHGFFGCFFPTRLNPHPMFVNWEKSVYPDYYQSIIEFVKEYRPIVVSRYPVPFPDYRPIDGFPGHDPEFFLSIPPF